MTTTKLTKAIDTYNAHLANCIIAAGPEHRKVCRHGAELDAAMFDAMTAVEANESRAIR